MFTFCVYWIPSVFKTYTVNKKKKQQNGIFNLNVVKSLYEICKGSKKIW